MTKHYWKNITYGILSLIVSAIISIYTIKFQWLCGVYGGAVYLYFMQKAFNKK